MGTYSPTKSLAPVGLDELGLRLGMQRLPNETLQNFRRRLLAEARDPATPTEAWLIRSAGRRVGQLDKDVFEIDLILDSSGEPLAADPRVQITSTYFRAYSDYANGVIDVEINFATSRWLIDLKNALAASTYFSTTDGEDYEDYLKTDQLRYDSTDRFRFEFTFFKSYENKLQDKYVDAIFFSDVNAFSNEVASASAIAQDGDYYIDKTNGVVFTYTTPEGTCSYSYSEFPFKVYWQPVRALPLNDDDLKYQLYTPLISDTTGAPEYTSLGPVGGWVFDQVLLAHPLGWGE